ncbi:MAG TPA: hypothetical protein VFS71_14320, partial [Flavobacterium sp.]|uniref:hypothetical protein n=1 Tax=Flavobacterium sp. TaxID=239 RepID=UPI002DBE82E2
MKAIKLILILMFYNSYAQTKITDFYVPEKVEINKAIRYIHFPNSNLSLAIPESYKYAYGEFVKENEIHIRSYPKNNNSFSDSKTLTKDWVKKSKQKGFYIFEKELKLGNYEAYLTYYNTEIEGKFDEISLILGNDTFTETVIGKFPRDKINAQKEVLSILLTSHIDNRQSPNYCPSDLFSIDCSNSDFKFHSNLSPNDFIYTPNGEGSLETTYQDLIRIIILSPIKTPEARKGNLQSMIEYYKNSHYEIHQFKKKTIEINGIKGHQIILNGSYQKIPISIYLIILNNEKATIN